MKKIGLVLLLVVSIIAIGLLFYLKLTSPDIKALNNNQIKNYEIYELSITENTNMDDIKELCIELDNGTIGDVRYIKLFSSQLKPYLYDCKEVNWIEQINEILYVSYITNDNIGVTLRYDKEGVLSKDIYDEKSDTLVSIGKDNALLYKNFQNRSFQHGTENKMILE